MTTNQLFVISPGGIVPPVKGEEMEKVELYPETIWIWTCPSCKEYHEEYGNPENVRCGECGGIFEPEYKP